MVKFKLRIFRSCRTKDASFVPEHPAPPCQRRKVIEIDLPCTTSPPPSRKAPHRSSFKSHVCSIFRCGSRSASQDLQWHVVAKLYHVDSPRPKIYNPSAIAGDHERFQIPIPPSPRLHKKKNRRGKKVKHTTSSAANYTADGGKEEQQREIISSSSRSFSTDSPEVPSPLSQPFKVKKKRAQSRHGGEGDGGVSPEWGSPARLSVFKKLMPSKVEGKVKESFAVVKRSENPYEDFKKSMMEMIVEKKMYEESDLKQLLQCFLSLNSKYHHGAIMEAFSEIWDTMFLHHRTFRV